ncbi:MAG: NB-ARC domain-containing protein [Chloroflexota bacterium]
MKQPSYRDRNYAFGRMMLTLRSAMGLTQTGLAELLGVSRYALGDWESGDKYPKADHLKHFITVLAQQNIFPAGHEAEEIRALWELAHQKVLLDEHWLAALLAPISGKATTGADLIPSQQTNEKSQRRGERDHAFDLPTQPTPFIGRVDWGDALSVPVFYGREWELEVLTEWIVEEHCRVVSVVGQGGIGKSALSVSLMYQVAERFDVVIWRSLRDAPTCEALLDGCLQVLAPQPQAQSLLNLEERLQLLREYLRSQRVLLVLDNLESILEEGEDTGRMRPGYKDYEKLLRRVGETEHQSCLLFTSREKPTQLATLEGNRSPVRALQLAQLDANACDQLLLEKGIAGIDTDRARLIEAYTGNPLALKIVSQTIVDLFEGEIALFLDQGEIIFGGIRTLLTEQFVRLSALEQTVLVWLAILREPSSLDDLLAVMVTPISRARLLEAMESLHRRSLIERGQQRGSFTLQSVVLEFGTSRLVAIATEEIVAGKPLRLLGHGFVLAHAPEYVRLIQERLFIAPMITLLYSRYVHQEVLEKRLLEVLTSFSGLADKDQGYAPSNLVTLLRLLRGHLRGLDLSRLTLRGAYLQGVEMQDTSLAGAQIQDSIFTETFDAMKAVALSGSGNYWAGSCRRGEVWLWEAGGLTLRRRWSAHADTVPAIAFSPDERFLATCGGWDSTVKLWDVASGRLLWTGRHSSRVNGVAFSPRGDLLATSSNDATIRVWDVKSGAELQNLFHPNPACAVTWSQDGRLLATGDFEGYIRLWTFPAIGQAICVKTFAGHPKWAEGLAFSPDGSTLASAGWEHQVKLWDVSSGRLLQTLDGPTDSVSRVAWSPDGRILASASQDKAIWLWDVELSSYRGALKGHSAGVVGLAFTADSGSLLSASDDGTLRLWNMSSGQCIRIIQGYADSIYDVDWSPDGAFLASAGTDGLITIRDVSGKTPPRVLSGHKRVVSTVAWSPDGGRLASSEWDLDIRLWDSTSGAALEVLEYPDDVDNFFYSFAWSPDGRRLASGTYRHGIQIVGLTIHDYPWAGSSFPVWIRVVAWSPDGTRLAGGGEDGVVYIFDAADGTLVQRLIGHTGAVNKVVWSRDGTLLASGGGSGERGDLFVWNPQRGERVASFGEHPGIVDGVSWGQNQDMLISGDGVGTLRWWDVTSGECLLERQAHEGMVKAINRSPDGTTLASCGDDGAIMLWDLESGEYLKTLRRDRPYERLNITGITGLTEAQKASLRALGAVEDNAAIP